MRSLTIVGIFVILACILVWPVIFQGKVLLPGEVLYSVSPWKTLREHKTNVSLDQSYFESICQYYPDKVLFGKSVRSGELPLWNPYKMCGVPFLAEPGTAVLYPPNLLYALLDPPIAFTILAVLHLLAAGLFAYIFLKGWGLSEISSVFGGIAFMLCSFGVTKLELPSFLSSGVWLPLCFHFARIAYKEQSPMYAAASGIMLALSFLGGDLQIAFYIAVSLGLYWLYLCIFAKSFRELIRVVSYGCLSLGIGLALAAPQLLPSYELALASGKAFKPSETEYSRFVSNALPLDHLIITLIAPRFFNRLSEFGGAISSKLAGSEGYVGVLPLILIPMAFWIGGKRLRDVSFFTFVLVLAVLASSDTPISRFLYFHIPGFACFESPIQALYLFSFSASVVGAVGLECLLGGSGEHGSLFPILTLLSGLAVVFLLIGLSVDNASCLAKEGSWPRISCVLTSSPSTEILLGVGTIILVIIAKRKIKGSIGGSLVISLLAVDLLALGVGCNPTSRRADIYPATKLTNFLKSNTRYERIMVVEPDTDMSEIVLPPNSAEVYGLFDVSGYSSLYPSRYSELIDAAAGTTSNIRKSEGWVFACNPYSPIYNLLGVRWVISPKPLGNSDIKIDECWVHENKQAISRAFLVRTIEFYEEREIPQRLANGETDLRYMALASVEDQVTFGKNSDQKHYKPSDHDSVSITSYSCNKVSLVVGARRRSLLVLTDQYYPGWEAEIDGKPARVMRVDFNFRAVAIPPGKHRVDFIYSPTSYFYGLRFAIIALICVVGLLVHHLSKQKSWI